MCDVAFDGRAAAHCFSSAIGCVRANRARNDLRRRRRLNGRKIETTTRRYERRSYDDNDERS